MTSRPDIGPIMRYARILAAIAAIFFFADASLAQTPAPAASSVPDVRELEAALAAIENPDAREKLAGQLRGLIAAHRAGEADIAAVPPTLGARLLSALAVQVEQINRGIVTALATLSDAPALADWLSEQASNPAKRSAWLTVFWKLAAILVAGMFARGVAARTLLRPRAALEAKKPAGYVGRSAYAAGHALLDVVPVAAFAAGAYIFMSVLEAGPRTRLVTVAAVNAVIATETIMAFVRAALAPRWPSLRPVPVSDETAHYAYIWTRRLAVITVFGYFISQAAALIGMPSAGVGFLLKVIGLVVATLLVILTMQNRAAVAAWLIGSDQRRGGALGTFCRRVADLWHVIVIFYIAALYAVWAVEIPGGFEYVLRGTALTVATVGIAGLAAWGVRRLSSRGFAVSDELRARHPDLETRVNRYLPVLDTVVRIAIAFVAVLFLLEAWGIGAWGWLDSPLGRRVGASAFSMTVILVLAFAVWEATNAAVERYLGRTDDEGRPVERSQRARTLIPLARKALLFVLVAVVVLVGLSELGVNIGPLLAGAGVVGLAIGFGSQKLVQDVITGAFILVEDAVSVGDVVKVGEHAGVVEAISIRSVRLRDLNGNVHTIPFSAVSTVINMTKDFSYYLLDVGVAYREDTDAVVDVLKEIDEELRRDPAFGRFILAPIEILGVDRFEDSAVVVRARVKTQPIQQWAVGREFNRRMKKRFDALGIEIPFPHATIYFGADKQGRAPAARVKMESLPRED